MGNCVIIIFQYFLIINIVILLQLIISLPNLHAQDDQTGFISLDCGRPNGYTDKDTGLRYDSDDKFIDTGVTGMIAPEQQSNTLYQQFLYVRSFPQGTRNCYTLKVPDNGSRTTFLIRGRFFYGNYDNKHSLPSFDLQIGVDLWDTVLIYNESRTLRKEIIYVPNSDFIQVCLINTNSGIPFISALEIRPFSDDTIYRTEYSLNYFTSWDLASSANNFYRYKDDLYDRIWMPYDMEDSTSLTSELPVKTNNFQVPNVVMNTANVPQNPNDSSLVFTWDPYNITDQFYLFLHFAELTPNASRKFGIFLNGELWGVRNYSPQFLQAETYWKMLDVSSSYTISLNRTEDSALPPLLNAIELYTIKKTLNSQTNDQDVGGIMGIKSTYKVLMMNNWQGDPCGPKPFSWDGIICSFQGFNPPQIISLNLSSSGLSGEISPFIQNLTSLQTLDLSNNNLSGDVPNFLFQFSSLQVLNLRGNNLTCPMPSISLQAKIKNILSDDCKGDSTATASNNHRNGNNNVIVVIAASVGGTLILMLILAAASFLLYFICIKKKHKKRDPTTTTVQSSTTTASSNWQSHNKDHMMPIIIGGSNMEHMIKNCQFSYSEILKITNNFEIVLGKGGFGTVYHAYVGNTQVAVKMLSQSSSQGYKEFQAEAKFLVSVNHKNLTSVVGYCYEDDKMGLVYEFMENGNLENHLSEKSLQILNWEERLQIAVDAAQGLDYLHNGCKPSIIHRDVKSSNILLNGNFEAKLADFGLSRTIPLEGSDYFSMVVAGTPGYLDPEYYLTNRVTEKSDVYDFGIVLLEIVTGKPTLSRRQDNAHIIPWVSAMISTGDVNQIGDHRLRNGDVDTNCLWKVVELAMACVSHESARRPNMSQVVMKLKECLASDIARGYPKSRDLINEVILNDELIMPPLAR
ncbi:putative leucine-rich repeat receptor-like protein kinase At2g19210 [Impatiens glandulifera]|uniref:putative leucine-rich repeat receptor-like protein kinase At2g19210 n=1 Tax=Impatiens glandulifera TaxID=253017 RepID=UPI001FB1427A|nr:putative leucine-rich repeat receptor-like protein kinase At2g19210 [Impatiens glandulifera]